MRRVATGDCARLISRLDAGVIAGPSDAIIARDSPETVIDPFERVDQRRPRRNWTGAQTPRGQAVPPNIWLSKRANGGTGQAATPIIVDVWAQFIAGEPIDLVFFDAVVNHLISEGDAIGRAGVSALAANLAEVFDSVVDGVIGDQGQISHDWVRHVDARAKRLVDDQPVSSELANSRGDAGGLRRTDAAQRRVSELFDVAFKRFEDHVALDLRDMIGGVAYVVPMRLKFVVIPGGGGDDDVGEFLYQISGRISLVGVLGCSVLDVAAAGV